MLGIAVQLALSWVIIYLVEKRDLQVLGFRPTGARLRDFALFLLISAVCSAGSYLARMIFLNEVWSISPKFSISLLLDGLWWNIKSVLFEELIFRGVLLFILIKRLGAKKAIIISAIAFGIYHWFSYGIIGDPVAMAYVFVVTGTMGIVLASGYAKTFSLYIPVAIHLGWNFTSNFLFSGANIGNGIFISATGSSFRTDSVVTWIAIQLIPMIAVFAICGWLIRRHKQNIPDGRVYKGFSNKRYG